jgi:serine protease Do
MNEYDLNREELNQLPEEQEQPVEQEAFAEQPVEQEVFAEREAAAEQSAAQEAPAESVYEAPAEPAYGAPAEPSYQDYFYASGPIRTARPAQNYNPQAGMPNYGAPNYSAPNYGAPNYGAPGYGVPNYGAPSYGNPRYAAPNYAQPQAPSAPEKKTGKKRGFWKKAVAAALACVLLGGGAGVGGALLVNRYRENDSGASSTAVQVAAPRETKDLNVVTVDSGKLMSASQVYKANVDSTVGITTEITTTNFWGYQSTGAAAGSGFILTEDGYILTNQHVIEKANTITVAMYDGTTYPAKLIGYDASNDIAVLKIEATGLTPVTLGDSDALEVGDEVVAIGNPLGELTFSLTKGNVSALNRAVTLSSSVTMNLIQTDAAINSGNSGGALFNMYGEVVGITNAKYSTSSFSSSASIDNIGFAIPINSVRNIVTSIIEKGYISTPYIGVSVANVGEESQSYGMPLGASIRSVEKDSPAEQAGLQSGDIVTAVNGQEITTYEGLKEHISDAAVGDQLELTVYRRSETLTITVTVGERTQSALPEDNNSQSDNGYGGYGGQGGIPWGYPDNP